MQSYHIPEIYGRRYDKAEEENVETIKIISEILPVSQKEWETAAFHIIQLAADLARPEPNARYIKKKFVRMLSENIEDSPADLQMMALSIWTKTQIEKEWQLSRALDLAMESMDLVSKRNLGSI